MWNDARGLLLLVCASLAGCAQAFIESASIPDVEFAPVQSIFVMAHDGERADLAMVLESALAARGFDVAVGHARPVAPPEVDVVLTYRADWWWDITPYLLRLSIQLRDPDSGAVFVTGQSVRPSLVRKSPPVMVDEVLDEIFIDGAFR